MFPSHCCIFLRFCFLISGFFYVACLLSHVRFEYDLSNWCIWCYVQNECNLCKRWEKSDSDLVQKLNFTLLDVRIQNFLKSTCLYLPFYVHRFRYLGKIFLHISFTYSMSHTYFVMWIREIGETEQYVSKFFFVKSQSKVILLHSTQHTVRSECLHL